jgi:chromosome segregation ATPase
MDEQAGDVMKFREIFERAASAFVDASRLAAEVKELREQMEATKAQHDKEMEGIRQEQANLKSHNEWLQSQLDSVTNERDTIRHELASEKASRVEEKQEHESALTAEQVAHIDTKDRLGKVEGDFAILQEQWRALTESRDQLYRDFDTLKAEHSEAAAKLTEVERKARELVGAFEPAASEPVPMQAVGY